MELVDLYKAGGVFAVIAFVLWLIIRELINYASKKQEELEHLKDSIVAKQLDKLESLTQRFFKVVEEVKDKVVAVEGTLSLTKQKHDNLMTALTDFIKETKQKFSQIESEIQNLGNGTFMVRGKKK